MPSQVVVPTSSALLRRMEELRGVPRSRQFGALRTNIQQAVVRGNREGLLAGTDGRGRPLAPLTPNSRKSGKYKGATGPPLVPFRDRSRFITQFRAVWAQEGDAWVLVRWWEDFDSPKGYPIAQAHLLGVVIHPHTGRRSLATRGKLRAGHDIVIPKRDVGPIRPQTWAQIQRYLGNFWEEYTRPR